MHCCKKLNTRSKNWLRPQRTVQMSCSRPRALPLATVSASRSSDSLAALRCSCTISDRSQQVLRSGGSAQAHGSRAGRKNCKATSLSRTIQPSVPVAARPGPRMRSASGLRLPHASNLNP